MITDFLISLWVGVLDLLSGSLPEGDTSMAAMPPGVSEFMSTMFYYIDPTPIGFLMQVLSGLLVGFIIYKAVNMIFNWISGLI